MKTSFSNFTAILLSLNLIYVCVKAQEETNSVASPVPAVVAQDKNEKDNMGLVCLLVLGCAAAAGFFIVYAMNTGCLNCKNKKLVLERDQCDGNWVAIATNYVGSVCTNKIEVFREKMNDSTCRYRVKVYDLN